MTVTDEQRLAVAVHEAAHAVVGVLSGATVRRAEVLCGGPRTNADGMHGFCKYREFDFAAEAHFRDIAAAGTIAEAVFHHGPAPTTRQIDALLDKNSGDRSELRRIYFASGGRDPMMPTTDLLPVVLRTWPSIAELAIRLDRDGVAEHTDVLAALEIPVDAPPHVTAHYAAAIRSGRAPGTFSITPALA